MTVQAIQQTGENEAYATVVAPDALRFERLLPGPIERVWAYLTESDKRAKWFGAGDMEPRAGSMVTLRVRHADLSPQVAPIPEKFKSFESGVSMEQRVLRFEPPHILSLTWGDKDAPSEVTFELTTEGEAVRLILTHTRLAGRAAMANAASGWHTHLAILVERLNDRIPPSFWTLFSEFEAGYQTRIMQAG